MCVLQTVLGLLDAGRRFTSYGTHSARVSGEQGGRNSRMERHGAEIVMTEMVVFERFESAEHPRFRDAITLIK